jgi:hypothetical protein
VTGSPSRADLAQLEDILDSSADERPLQRFLGRTPTVLADLATSSFGSFVIPLPRLGSHYVPDFVLAIADSAGIHYTLVELESPTKPLARQDGELAAKAREAVHQIEDWREWLKDNLAHAQRPREEHGLGLPEIRPESPAIVLIGRRSQIQPWKNQRVRQRLREHQGITIHSYDWLVEVLQPRARARSALGPLDVDRDWERPNPFELDAGDEADEMSPFA